MRVRGLRDLAWALLLAAGVGIFVPTFMALVRSAGHRIPQPNIEADYLTALVWATFLGAGILLWPAPARDKPPLLVLWAAKCFVTLGFMLFYEWNYPLDSYFYFDLSRAPRPPVGEMGWGNGTENFVAMAWVHGQLLPDSYHAMKVSFAMVGLIAVYLIYRAAVKFRGIEDRRILYLLGLFPSVLFWSSILGKDPVQLLGIALYVYGVVGVRRSRYWWLYLAPVAAGIALSAFIRLWSGPILLLPLLVFVFRGIRGVVPRVIFLLLTYWALDTAVARFAEMFGLLTLQDVYATVDALSQGWEGGSGQVRMMQISDLDDMLRFAPQGSFTALFRPLPGEVMNPFGQVAGIENLLLLALAVLSCARTRARHMGEPLVAWAIVLVITWATVYGFVSYYNLGAAVRFKLQILPVLLLLLLFLSFGDSEGRSPVAKEGSPI